MPATDPLMPEDSLDDPELDFGEVEMAMEPMVHDVRVKTKPEPEPEPLSSDANPPLDFEPDADLSSTVEFTDNSPELESAGDESEIKVRDAFDDHQGTNGDEAHDEAREEAQLEIKSLQAELQGLRDEREALVERNRELTERIEQAAPSGELSRLQGQLNEARKHHKQAEDELTALKRELEQARGRVLLLEGNVAEAAAPVTEDTRRELDLMDAQIKALQTENTQLKEALKEAQGAESRTEHAHDELGRRVAELGDEIEALRAELEEGRVKLEARIKEIEELGRELAVARKDLADQSDASDDVQRKARELDDRRAELEAANKALVEARLEIQRLQPFENEVARVEGLEDRITALQEVLVSKEKDCAELQEKLDSEAARSYRLSQRRIPALNSEIESMQENSRELERKMQKAELKANTFEEQSKELETKLADLQRALQGAKARAQDTAIFQPGETDARAQVGDEVRRLTNRMHELEEERGRLVESMRKVGQAHKSELAKHAARGDRLEQESDQRYEDLLKQRTQMRVLRERMNGMLKLAEDLNATAHGQRQPLLEALRKLGDVPPDTN